MSYLKQIEKEYRLIRIYDNANKKIDNIRYKKKEDDFFRPFINGFFLFVTFTYFFPYQSIYFYFLLMSIFFISIIFDYLKKTKIANRIKNIEDKKHKLKNDSLLKNKDFVSNVYNEVKYMKLESINSKLLKDIILVKNKNEANLKTNKELIDEIELIEKTLLTHSLQIINE